MGRLIPAGTGMKYYRNVRIAPDATENRKQEDEFDEMGDYIRGGIELTPALPLPNGDEDTDEGYDEAEETLDELSLETDEVFDDAMEGMGVTVSDNDEL